MFCCSVGFPTGPTGMLAWSISAAIAFNAGSGESFATV
jgi:hypothetical protein